MWTCPECNREFRNRNQPHSCGDFSIEELFERFPPEIFNLFECIHNQVIKYDKTKVNPVKNGVMYSVNSTFLALKPHKTYLAIEFASKKMHNEFPVEKCVPVSKRFVAHILRIDSLENIDRQLMNWIKEAHSSNL